MLTRRLGLLASALVLGAGPALAQQKHHPPARARTPPPQLAVPPTPRLAPSIPPPGGPTSRTIDTGASLLEKQADDEMPPSSMTKLMTLYLVYDQLKQGRLKLGDELPVTRESLAHAGLEDVRANRHHGEGRGPDPRCRRAIRQRRGDRSGGSHRRIGRAVRRKNECESQRTRSNALIFQELHRLAGP